MSASDLFVRRAEPSDVAALSELVGADTTGNAAHFGVVDFAYMMYDKFLH